jgi:hypothetical protein
MELDIGPFDALGKHPIRIVATDKNGNVTQKDVTVEVYSPVPSILQADTATASGTSDLSRSGEPVDFFRFRADKLSRLDQSGALFTDDAGGFLGKFTAGNGVRLNRNGIQIATVDEKTGKVISTASGYSLTVSAATADSPSAVRILGTDGKEVYAESFVLPTSLSLRSVNDWKEATENGAFVHAYEGSAFVRNASDAPSLPGGGFLVTRADSKAYAGVGRDGNIYLLSDGYSLSYRNEGDYPVIVVKNSFGVVVAEVMYRMSAEFVIK